MGERVNVCVPTGNFGNILAAFYARQHGTSHQKAAVRVQRQQCVDDFIKTGVYDQNRPFFNTPSSVDGYFGFVQFGAAVVSAVGLGRRRYAAICSKLKETGRYKEVAQLRRARCKGDCLRRLR